MGTFIIVFFVCFCIVAIACGIWQINLAINHPEKYERLEKWKKDYAAEQAEMARKVAAVGAKAFDLAMKVTKKK